jgi:hypothetical protein
MAKNMMPTMPTAVAKRGLRKWRTSNAGWSIRRSYQTKTASTTTPSTVGTTTSGLVTVASSPPRMMP